MNDKNYYVYIVGNERPTLYVGVTNDLVRRVFEHKNHLVPGFTEKYGLAKLLYFESHGSAIDVITREKKLKGWNREWKLRLIRKSNPELTDLYSKIVS